MAIPEARVTRHAATPLGGLSEKQDLFLPQIHRRVLGMGCKPLGFPSETDESWDSQRPERENYDLVTRSSDLTYGDLPIPSLMTVRVVTFLSDCHMVTNQSFKRGEPFIQWLAWIPEFKSTQGLSRHTREEEPLPQERIAKSVCFFCWWEFSLSHLDWVSKHKQLLDYPLTGIRANISGLTTMNQRKFHRHGAVNYAEP